jgi:hypothetical protein
MRRVYLQLREWGLDPRLFLSAISGFAGVLQDYRKVRRQWRKSPHGQNFKIGQSYFIYKDKTDRAGAAKGHYFWQDLLVAREIHSKNPTRHIDVGSSVAGFVAHVASFREIEVIDIRPLENNIPGVIFTQGDITRLDIKLEGVADSISCLHTLEHIGLGRYGDELDFDGWISGFENLASLLSPGGTMYLSVPTGESQRIEFNAHRVFSLPFLADFIGQRMNIERVTFLDDHDNLYEDVDLDSVEARDSFGSNYGLSIWFLSKPGSLPS